MGSSPRIDDLASPLAPGAEPLTGIYGTWARSLFPEPIPREERSSCSACPMVSPDPVASPRSLPVFSAAVKCCTYLPTLPNYLVGAILDDPEVDPRGRDSIARRIERRAAVTPLGLGQTGTFKQAYETSVEEVFGRAEVLRCPHYLDDGGCGIWKHRNSICTTWFCKHQRGQVGYQFWMAFRDLLIAIESELTVWVAGQAGIPAAAIADLIRQHLSPERRLLVEELTGKRPGIVAAELWGTWRGRETEYFIETARLVAQLSWHDVLKLCGSRVRVVARHVMDRYAALLMPRLPQAIQVQPIEPTELLSGLLSFRTFSPYDPIVLTRDQWQALQSLADKDIAESPGSQPIVGPISKAMLQVALDWGLVRAER